MICGFKFLMVCYGSVYLCLSQHNQIWNIQILFTISCEITNNPSPHNFIAIMELNHDSHHTCKKYHIKQNIHITHKILWLRPIKSQKILIKASEFKIENIIA